MTLAQLVDAVQWAIQRLDEQALRDDAMDTMRPRLQAVVEMLETWEFGREVLK